MLSNGQKLATRLERALEWKREAWLQSDILDGLGRDPSFERDVADDAYRYAMRKWRQIVRSEWELRGLERTAFSLSQNAVTHNSIQERAA